MKLAELKSEEAQTAADAYERLSTTVFAEVQKRLTPPHIVTRVLILHAANSAAAMELSREAFLEAVTAAFDRARSVIPPEMS
jgi:hypothetical protein